MILEVNGPREFGPMSEVHDYPVLDSLSDSRIGTVRLSNDGWVLLNQSQQKAASFKGPSAIGDVVKPTVTVQRGGLVPTTEGLPAESWDGYVNEVHVCRVVKLDAWYPRISVDCSLDTRGMLDRRLTMASVLVKMALAVYEIKVRYH